jgi:hypothetical protein
VRTLYDLWFQIAQRIESSWNFFLILHIALLGVNLARRVQFGLAPCVVFLMAYSMFVYLNVTGLLFSYAALNALAADIQDAHESAKFLPDSRRFLAYLAEHGGAEDHVWRVAVTHGVAAAYIIGLVSLFYVRSLAGRPALWEILDLLERSGLRAPRPRPAAPATPIVPAADRPASPPPPENH